MEQVEFEDDTQYICYEYHKENANAAALRLLQVLHARDRVEEELLKVQQQRERNSKPNSELLHEEGTQGKEKID